MDVKFRSVLKIIAPAVLSIVATGGVRSAADVTGSRAVVIALDATVDGQGSTIDVKTTGPVPRFTINLQTLDPAVAILEFPTAESRLRDQYEAKGPLCPEVHVEHLAKEGAGVRIRFLLRQVGLSSLEQTADGLRLRFDHAPAVAAAPPGTNSEEYKVGIGDKIEVAVFGHDDLNRIVEVGSDGRINYPLIGDLAVAGKTVQQIDGEVTGILGKDYLVEPQVSVDVKEYHSQWITVIGEVRSPGRYVLKRNMRLIDLLAEAGGTTKEAGSEILITRRPEGGSDTKQIAVDRDRLLSRDNQGEDIALRHGDIITIGEKDVFYIRGEVSKPGPYFFDKGMTVLNAVSVAGGLSQFANRKVVELLRTGREGVQQKIIVNLKAIEDGKKQDIPLLPNDTIIVPKRVF